MIDLAVFDIAGTTLDEGHQVYRVLRQCVEDRGATITDAQFRNWMGTEKRSAITNLLTLGGVEADTGTVDEAYGWFVDALARAYREQPPSPFPGVAEVIADLRGRGVKVGLSTGFSTDVAESLLTGIGWTVGGADATLDALVCADQVAQGRPAPYMIHEAMQRTGVLDVHRVLAAGDTIVDLQAAHHAGVIGVGVLTGSVPAEILKAQPHAHVLSSLADLPTIPEYATLG
ncbi:phosphonatase-like hydrolase [Mycolicibacterium sp.]|uniref:phosphonatase-like hydrolase n=1 Tax=Mycolicibacterium sp. TaxID=2320850 RepID=UPI00355E5E4E